MGLAALVRLVAGVGPAALELTVKLRAEDLRCEFRAKPMGIDEPQPRPSWVCWRQPRKPRTKGSRPTAWAIVDGEGVHEDRARAEGRALRRLGRLHVSCVQPTR